MASLNLTIRTDADVLRLIHYREVLREMVRAADDEPWKLDADTFIECAREALRAHGDLP